MILTLFMVVVQFYFPIVAKSKQGGSTITNTKFFPCDDAPFVYNINYIKNNIKATIINKDSGNITNVNITIDDSMVIS